MLIDWLRIGTKDYWIRGLSTISTSRATKSINNFCLSCYLFYLDSHAFILVIVLLELLTWPLVERSPGMDKLLSTSPDAPYKRCWLTFRGVWLPIKAPRCFLFLDSTSTRRGSRNLAFSRCLLVVLIPFYQWLLWPCILYYLWSQIPRLFLTLAKLFPLAFSLCCPISAMIHGIYCIFFT